MNDRDALLAAIIANPDDDTPRLVLADWLDENDQPHWAALIRIECACEQLRDDGSPAESLIRFLDHIEKQGGCGHIAARVRWDRADTDVGRRLALEREAAKLRPRSARVRNAGRPAPAKCGLSWGTGTCRGFQASATVIDGTRFARHFIRHADTVVRWCPSVELTIEHSSLLPIGRVERGLLRWAHALNLAHTEPELFEEMSTNPAAAGVRALTYRPSAAAATGRFATALAGSPYWTGLRSLEISNEGVTGDTAATLFQSQHMGGLTRLRLCSRNWTLETMDAFLRAPLHNLRELMLAFGNLGDDEVERLAASPLLANLQYLDLSHNRITARGLTALLTSKHLKSLTILELERNPIQNLDRAVLATAPAGGLRAISFHNCDLTTEDVDVLAKCPRLAELVYLDLDYNRLNDAAIDRLVSGLVCTPAVVYLMGNQITTDGARALARWAGKPGLDQLHVCRNPLTGEGAAALATSRSLAGLRHICATGLDLADRGVLEKRFKNRVEFPL